MVSVVYHGLALPLAWLVVKQPKGHLTETRHCALLAMIQPLIPPTATVIVLGDGEFDGITLQARLTAWGWQYVCRTALEDDPLALITTLADLEAAVAVYQ